ncbi:hypothetical protein [Bacteroides sp.]|uniref:hypothetical protein n=1 Tax=Bacteroides sp. TaxID=29523 RepID=UPI00262D4F07|nr:hypothetical protein [Bacteroides sp.]MDD3036293.1 hypothetical protein [Bacteroides sp.]
MKEYAYHFPNQTNNDLCYASQFYKYLFDDYECTKGIEKDDATSFYNRRALVYQNNKLFYIDKAEKWIEDF